MQVLFFLPAPAAMRVHLASRSGTMVRCAISEALWEAQTRIFLGFSAKEACKGPDGEDVDRWSVAFARWYAATVQLGRPPLEAKEDAAWIRVWRRMRRWLGHHAPDIDATLRPPVAPELVAALSDFASGREVATAVLGLWSVCDGQDAPVEQSLASELRLPVLEEDGAWWHGLFGGYSAYDYEVSTVLLPLHGALALTRILQQSLMALRRDHPTKLAFASSFNFSKVLMVDVCDGMVYAWTRRLPLLESSVPVLESADGVCAGSTGALRWMEEYTRRLEEGIYKMAPLKPERSPTTQGISLFPSLGPDLSRGVSRGVEVMGCCVYMPEHPQGWAYSISLRLTGTAEERGFATCQLKSRHWQIQEEGREAEHVHGEGVIGFFPILTNDGWILNCESDPHGQYISKPSDCHMPAPFCYQSCAGRLASMRGHFTGELLFVPGTIRHPTAAPFQARLPPFRLQIPEYIY